MANLAITRRCLRGCAYCFAADERARGAVSDMSPEVFEAALDFLERSGVPDARLLGGEPLLHPDFGALARRALERGFALTVMTGGLVSDAALTELAALADGAPTAVTVFLNAALPGRDDPALVAAQERILEALGPKVELGVTLSPGAASSDSEPSRASAPASAPSAPPIPPIADFLLDRIARYGASRSIRVGIAHPIWHGANASAATADLRSLGHDIESLVARAEAADVRVGFDCGLTPCMFSPDFAAGHPRLMAQTGTRCGPIVDVLPEGDAIACFALSRAPHVPLGADATRAPATRAPATRADCVAAFDAWFEAQPHSGIFEDCEACAHRATGRCGGGCRARQLARAEAGGG